MATRKPTAGRLLFQAAVLLLILGQRPCMAVAEGGRLCVTSDVDCTRLTRTTRGAIKCLVTRDRVDCLKKIANKEAGFGYFDAEGQRMAAQMGKDLLTKFVAPVEFSVKESTAVYLLVNNGTNTSPKTLCHPGFNRERFYPRALYSPTTLDTINPTGNIENLITSLSRAWESACIPGAWSPDPITDRQLKRDHPHLCNSCLRKSCDLSDPYVGSGALQCLLDHAADAAFVSNVDFDAERAQNPEVEKLFHFCKDREDPIQPLGDKATGTQEPCDWGRRPPPVLLTRACSPSDLSCLHQQRMLVDGLTRNPEALKEALDLPRKSTTVRVNAYLISAMEAIKKAGYKIDSSSPEDSVTFCVQTETELEKCKNLAAASAAYNGDGSVGIKCRLDHENCYPSIYFGDADVITLDGGDVYEATQDYGFQRILSEVYETETSTSASSYYAVAVVKADSNITSFEHLQGRKSCHTGIGKTAGWKMPVGTLLEQRLINPRHCDYVSAVAEFFSGGSCAPGGKSSNYNKQQNYVDRLCRLCIGRDEDQCARSSSEPFYSYSGAFRCLVHGGGDVAFVKHTTVPSFTVGSTSDSWAVGLQASQFKLLCPSGGTAAINEYKTCNLALVPAHETVVSGRMSEDRKRTVRETLLGISQIFNSDAAGSKTFKLFGSFHGRSDLLFKDSAVGLRALSEDTQEERERKKNYFKKLGELHSCEVRVCALEEELSDCKAMAHMMLSEGQQFVCVSTRDRMDCVYRVIRGQVDMAPIPGTYLGINPDLRVFAIMKQPSYSQQEYRYKAVMVVRKSTIRKISDLRGKKSCHTGYGRTTGWRIPVALLKREGVISPLCGEFQSSLEHEIASVAVTFNRACIPGTWAVSPSMDSALKEKYKAMCSMCNSGTCEGNDDYAGYEGALRCLTQNNGDVAFSKLRVVQEFFQMDTRSLNIDDYGFLCPDNKIVGIDSPEAEECYWASRPWDAYVTHGGASDTKVQRIFWALTQAKIKGEEDLTSHHWYYSTLGISDTASDILPVMEDVSLHQYYSKTRMDVVEAEEMCSERAVRFCVTDNEEEEKCNDLRSVLTLRGISPPLQCVRGNDTDNCAFRISVDQADVMSMDDIQRYRVHQKYNLVDLLSEKYGPAESTRFFLVAVVMKSPDLNSTADLPGKTTCHSAENATESGVINYSLKDCLSGTSDFYDSFSDAISCLAGSSRDVAFVKIPTTGGMSVDIPSYLQPERFELLCENGTMPLSPTNILHCNLGRVPADVIVTRQSEVSARRQDMMHLLLKSAKEFGKKQSFFRLFYDYFSKKDLMFKDATTELTTLTDKHYQIFLTEMWQQACQLYDHHQRTSKYSK